MSDSHKNITTEEDAIYIVKGRKRSALINLQSFELRAIANERIAQLADDVEMEPDLSRYTKPQNDVYDKEILDIKLLRKHPISEIDDHLRDGMVYHNVRIICPEDSLVEASYVKEIANLIHQKVYHFGVLVIISDAYDITHFKSVCRTEKVISYNSKRSEEQLFVPYFDSSPRCIQISKSHNLFHFSRDTLLADGETVQLIDHDQYDIPKHKIAACNECEFRLTCYDSRPVRQNGEKYYYDSVCKYELDRQ